MNYFLFSRKQAIEITHMSGQNEKPRMAVHKFSSCDGCQLAILNMGSALAQLSARVDIVHFAEMGPIATDATVDIALVEGSVATQADIDRIKAIRKKSKLLVTIGACATSGGVQALRNINNDLRWQTEIYPHPDALDSLPQSYPISEHVSVDHQLWGCPVNSRQVLDLLNSLLFGVRPRDEKEILCLECKRKQNVCTLVSQGSCCMGPVTRSGCGALCPGIERDCYGCYGAAEGVNVKSLANRFTQLISEKDLAASQREIQRAVENRFRFIHRHEIDKSIP